jgi:hypothetical protein
MTIPVTEGGGGGGWKAPPSSWDWTAANDPVDGANAYMLKKPMDQLLAASATAFEDVEKQLLAVAELAEVTARGLDAAKGADWQGNAGDQYRATLSKLPADLYLVNEYFVKAHTTVSGFAEMTLRLKANFISIQDSLVTLKGKWRTALEQTYPSRAVGRAAITKIEDEMTQLCDQGRTILGEAYQAHEDFNPAMGTLANAAPSEGVLTMALAALTNMWHDMTGTGGAILNFVHDPTWKNLRQMGEDMGLDAGVLAVVFGGPLGAEALGMIDLGESGTALFTTLGDAAGGIGVGAGAVTTASDVEEGDWAAAVFDAWGAAEGIGDSEVDDAVDDVSALNALSKLGHLPDDLTSDELAALKKLVGDPSDPAAVARAAANADNALAEATLAKNPEEFLKEHFITDPLEGAVAGVIDGNGNNNGG